MNPFSSSKLSQTSTVIKTPQDSLVFRSFFQSVLSCGCFFRPFPLLYLSRWFSCFSFTPKPSLAPRFSSLRYLQTSSPFSFFLLPPLLADFPSQFSLSFSVSFFSRKPLSLSPKTFAPFFCFSVDGLPPPKKPPCAAVAFFSLLYQEHSTLNPQPFSKICS